MSNSYTHTRTHARTFNGHFSRTTWVSQYQKGKTNLDFTEARYSEWQWHQLGHIQVSTSLQSNNHASTHQPLLSFSRAGCPSCHSTNDVKAQHHCFFAALRTYVCWVKINVNKNLNVGISRLCKYIVKEIIVVYIICKLV